MAFANALEHLVARVQRAPQLSPAVKALLLAHLDYLANARVVGLLPEPKPKPKR